MLDLVSFALDFTWGENRKEQEVTLTSVAIHPNKTGAASTTALTPGDKVVTNLFVEAQNTTAALKSRQFVGAEAGTMIDDAQAKTIKENLENLLTERSNLQEMAKGYEAVRRWQLDYKTQSEELLKDGEKYKEQLQKNAKIITAFSTYKAGYVKDLKTLIWPKSDDNNKEVKKKLKGMFVEEAITKSEIAAHEAIDQTTSNHDDMMTKLSVIDANNALREKSINRQDALLVLDLLEHQIQNYEINEVIEVLKQNIIPKMHFEDKIKAFMLVYPLLHKLGRDNEVKEIFKASDISEAVMHLFAKKQINDVTLEDVALVISEDVPHVLDGKTSLEDAQNKLKLLLALKDDGIMKLHDNNRRNILHLLIAESAEIKLGGSDHKKAVVMVDTYIKLFESVCESLDNQTLAKLLRQRDKNGETPTQLFYRLAKTGSKQNVIHPYNQTGVKWIKSILRYTGTVDIPSKNWRENAWYTFIADATLTISSRFAWNAIEKVVETNTGVNITANGNIAVDLLKDSIFVAALSPKQVMKQDEWDKHHLTGYEEMHHLNLDGINLIGIMNTGDFYNDASVENIASLETKLDSQKNKILGSENRYILKSQQITSKANQFTIKEKLDHYRTLVLRHAFIKEALNAIDKKQFRSSWFGWFINSSINRKKGSLEAKLVSIKKSIKANLSAIEGDREFKGLSANIRGKFSQLFDKNNHNSDIQIARMAYAISSHPKASYMFDRFYSAVNEGLIPLDFDALEKLYLIFNEIKMQRSGKTVSNQIQGDAKAHYSELGNNIVKMMNEEIGITISQQAQGSDTKQKEFSFTLSDYITARVNENFSEPLVSFNPLIEKQTWLNTLARAVDTVTCGFIKRKNVVETGVVIGSRVPDLTEIAVKLALNLATRVASGASSAVMGGIFGGPSGAILGGLRGLASSDGTGAKKYDYMDNALKMVRNFMQVEPNLKGIKL